MGHGKSYGVVANVILPALSRGRHVVTNIPLKTDLLFEDFPEYKELITYIEDKDFDMEAFRYSNQIKGAYYVFDEVGTVFPNGIKQNNVEEDIQLFFTKHRHSVNEDGFSCEIVLIVQDFSMLANFIRLMTEEVYKMVKITSLGSLGSKNYNVFIYTPVNGRISKSNLQKEMMGKYQEKHWKYYVSHTNSENKFSGALEEKVDSRNNLFKSWKFWIFIGCMLLAVFTFFYQGYVLYSNYSNPSEDQEINSPSESPKKKINIPPPSGYRDKVLYTYNSRTSPKMDKQSIYEIDQGWKTYLEDSDEWRITGEISGDVPKILIESKNGTRAILASLCSRFDKTQELYCVVRGKLVTYYTGILEEESETFLALGGKDE